MPAAIRLPRRWSHPAKRRPKSSSRPTCIAALPGRGGHPVRSIANEDGCRPMQLRAGDPPTAVAPGAVQQLQHRKTAVQLGAGDSPTGVAPGSTPASGALDDCMRRPSDAGQAMALQSAAAGQARSQADDVLGQEHAKSSFVDCLFIDG